MPAIVFRPREETRDVVIGDVLPPGPFREKVGEGEMSNRTRMFHPGGPDSLQLFEVTVEPNRGAHTHAHAEDEIMYVVDGEMHFGNRVLTVGSSVYIPAYTLYSFRAGPEGLRFLNFRARANDAYITKDELMAMRGERATTT